MVSLFQRYESGATSEVWAQLRALGPRVREAEFIEDARAVCDAMARRALRNVETLIDRLAGDGFVFTDNIDGEPRPPLLRPSPGAQDLIEWLNAEIGTLPLAVESWIRIVGDVSLIGVHPRWNQAAEADPLVVEVENLVFPSSDPRAMYAEELDVWREPGQTSRFVLPVSPDSLHKANVSGSVPYGFPLPDASAEGAFVNEDASASRIHEPFVDYLNRAFRAGGFPGSRVEAPAGLRERYAAGLLEL